MRLRTIGLIVTLALGLLVAPLLAEAQQAGKVYRIGYLSAGVGSSQRFLTKGLRKLGYVEGQNFALVHRSARGKRERLPKLATELVDLKVDVIVVTGVGPGLAAKNATTTIPIVAVTGVDLVKAGLVANLARPGGNVTGFTMLSPELAGKRLELLKEAFPSISRVGVLREPLTGSALERAVDLRQFETAAEALGLEHYPMEVSPTNPDFDGVFDAAMKRRVDAIVVPSGGFFRARRERILELVAKTQLPAMYVRDSWVRRGGLMFYGPRRRDLTRRAATYVDRILKGAKPGDLPVQRARRFYLIINLKTARKQGLTIPPQFLARADKVIK